MKARRPSYNRKKGLPKGYDSIFEYDLHKGALSKWEHHNKDHFVSYTIQHIYEPDFTRVIGDELYILETKGRFRTTSEASKYIAIREAIADIVPFDYVPKFCFLFYSGTTPMPHAKRRKDGTKLTVGEWATKHKFEWYTPETLPSFLI